MKKDKKLTHRNAIFPLTCVALPLMVMVGVNTAQAQGSDLATTMGAAIEQSGAGNTAVIEQQNVVPETYANIEQHGSDNNAYVLQIGPEFFDDESTYLVTANAVQEGVANSVVIEQIDGLTTSAESTQTGFLNTATITQDRERAYATVNQHGGGNTATIEQPGEFWDTYADVKQTGVLNEVYILQDETNYGSLDSRQAGIGNVAIIHQTDSSDFGTFQTLRVDTTGNGNNVDIYQNSGGADITMLQTGNLNTTTITQTGEGGGIEITSLNSHGNEDVIWQAGGGIYLDRSSSSFNQVNLRQFFSTRISVIQESTLFARVDVTQDPFFSIADISQYQVVDSSALVTQSGRTNTALIEQAQVIGSAASIQSLGGSLVASIYQLDGADLSTADIAQEGSQNTALVNQIESSNSEASILQTGSNGYAQIQQEVGTLNVASIDQSGNGYNALITQTGSGNFASIVQP